MPSASLPAAPTFFIAWITSSATWTLSTRLPSPPWTPVPPLPPPMSQALSTPSVLLLDVLTSSTVSTTSSAILMP
ncbi:hypothetical protein BC830DRAFT_1112859 [Chytriomyces sp. MP71]|nr:hypothetical protein BC830DRAFT_1112859 [Chytriomyces sp. MP71]